MKSECFKRKIDTSKATTADDYINLLLDDDKPDWGRIYCRVLYHTGMSYEEIERRTIPQIMAILEGAGENIPINMGLPSFSTPKEEEAPQDNETRLAQVDQYLRAFNG